MIGTTDDTERGIRKRVSEQVKATMQEGVVPVKKQERKPRKTLREKIPGRLRRRYDVWIKLGFRMYMAERLTRAGSFYALARMLSGRKSYSLLGGMTEQEKRAVYYTLWKREGLDISSLRPIMHS